MSAESKPEMAGSYPLVHLALKDGTVACGARYEGMMAMAAPPHLARRELGIANNITCKKCRESA